MKKYFPLFIPMFIALFVLIGQAFFKSKDINAKPTEARAKINKHYESIFSDQKFKTLTEKEILLSVEKAPIVILNFWASWCIPCLEEFPSIVSLKKKFGDDKILVLGINTDEKNNLPEITKTMKKFGINFPVVHDADGSITSAFKVSAIPVSIIFHKGKVIEVSNGAYDFYSEENLEKFTELLKN